MVSSFLVKNLHFISKNAILCLFLKNVSLFKRVVCFILNYLHFPMLKGIAFYSLYKSRVLIIPCKADDFRLFIGLPDEIFFGYKNKHSKYEVEKVLRVTFSV